MLHYEIEVRDSMGKPYINEKGFKVVNSFKFKDEENDENLIQLICQNLAMNYTAISKSDSFIYIKVSCHNKISNTYPILYSFYANENRFVKH